MNYTVLTAKQAMGLNSRKFHVPDKNAVKMLLPGNMVLVVVDFINSHSGRPQAEPLWCVVMRRDHGKNPGDDKLVLAVWDHPMPKKTAHHGLGPKSLLTVKPANVVDIMFEQPKTEVKII